MPGGFGQNGSVAWIVKARNAGSPHNHGNQGNGHGGDISEAIDFFTVRLRFPSEAAAQNAWDNRQDVTSQWSAAPGQPAVGYVVTLRVPAQGPDPDRRYANVGTDNEPDKNPPWEVRVDW